MFLIFKDLLPKPTLAKIRAEVEAVELADGALSGRKSLKRNLQSLQGNPGLEPATQAVIQALMQRGDFKAFAVPKQISVVFNRYETGMHYKNHMDAAVMGGLQRQPMRSDLSFTLFLNDPDDYGGGELVVQTEYGEVRLKEPAGNAVVYPSNMIHRVETVAEGYRLAAIGWLQSMIRDAAQRQLLYQVFLLRRDLVKEHPDSPFQEQIDRIRENLLRLWAEV